MKRWSIDCLVRLFPRNTCSCQEAKSSADFSENEQVRVQFPSRSQPASQQKVLGIVGFCQFTVIVCQPLFYVIYGSRALSINKRYSRHHTYLKCNPIPKQGSTDLLTTKDRHGRSSTMPRRCTSKIDTKMIDRTEKLPTRAK